MSNRNNAGAPEKRSKTVTRSGKILVRPTSHPPHVPGGAHPLDEATVEFLPGNRVTQVVAPVACNVEVTPEQSLLAEPGLVQHADTGLVRGTYRGFQSMQPGRAERV